MKKKRDWFETGLLFRDSKSELSDLEYWQLNLWQLVRYNVEYDVEIRFMVLYAVPWWLTVSRVEYETQKEKGSLPRRINVPIGYNQGKHLWKRLRYACIAICEDIEKRFPGRDLYDKNKGNYILDTRKETVKL